MSKRANYVTVVAMFFNLCNIKNIFQYNFSEKCQIIFSIVIIITCVFNLISAPLVVPCVVDDWSDVLSTSLTVVQSRVVAVASFLSRAIVLYNVYFNKYQKYKTTLESSNIYSPMTAAAWSQYKLYSLVTASLCLIFMLPTNFVKLYSMYYKHLDGSLLVVHFFFFYLQNFSMYLIENDFANRCFVVYLTFRNINDDLNRMKTEHIDRDRFPFFGKDEGDPWSNAAPSSTSRVVVYDKDFYCPRDKAHPLTNIVEILKIRHWLTREAVVDINYLFGNHLGLSILSLGVLVLLDVYTGVFHSFANNRVDKKIFRSTLLFFRVLQYSYRFCVITILSNVTAKEAVNAKTLITDINNRYLDTSTQEELQLFYTQISSRCIEFTACDLFTLNTRLITSAIAAGATYLVILVQFHSGKN
ncbi:uncharacterized protein LOC111034994 isoform X1 [Myzus persicae]|uniref:uncharacterized protein LOC111034994 isoform X1 n=1 Tax=Myzus persicae TaxID=13164 RepID=UPI000B939478|nr:uncharacterized protein LOC111034994 isoform X1 [Myzus persicae]